MISHCIRIGDFLLLYSSLPQQAVLERKIDMHVHSHIRYRLITFLQKTFLPLIRDKEIVKTEPLDHSMNRRKEK